MNYIEIKIQKPLYDNFVRIRENHIKEAIKKKALLKIVIPQGVGYHDPKEWKKTGKRVEQEFLIPGHPMILWGNYVSVSPPEDDMEEFSKQCL